MTESTRLVPKGLVTEPSRLIAGDGGLLRAHNVICRAPGLIESRAQIRATFNPGAMSGNNISVHARKWRDEVAFALPSTDGLSAFRGVEPDPLISMEEPARWRTYSEVADGRAIWAFPAGLRCMDSPTQDPASSVTRGFGAFARMPGAARLAAYASNGSTATNGALAPDETCAYRVTLVRWIVNADGVNIPIEGPPSDRYVFRNTNPTDEVNTGLTFVLPGHVRPGDEVRVYRTATNGVAGADPGDEMILRWSRRVEYIPSSDDAEEEIVFRDFAAPDEWGGPALYTNASQQGALRANYRLRTARDLATYQGNLFYAGGSAGYRQSTSIRSIGPVSDELGFDQTLLSIESTGVATTGSTTVSGLPPLVMPYLSVGQVIAGTTLESSTFIGVIASISVPFLSVELEAPSPIDATSFVAWDWVSFTTQNGDTWKAFFPYTNVAFPTVTTPATMPPFANTGIDPLLGAPVQTSASGRGLIEGPFAWTFARDSVNGLIPRLYTETGPNWLKDVVLTIEWDASFATLGVDQVSFESPARIAITSSKPRAFSDRIERTYDESIAANPDGSPGTLWWSKNHEPESVPLGNYAVIGDEFQPIARIFGTTDRLFVLKTDGLFCLYGGGDQADSFTVQPVDSTFRMIDTEDAPCSAWAAKIRDTIYAWTQTGIMAVGSQGAGNIDADIQTMVRRLTPGFGVDQSVSVPPGGSVWCAASPRDQLVLFGSHVSDNDGTCLVYCVDSDTWSTIDALPVPTGETGSGFIVPTLCSGYGTSDDGTLCVPSVFGYATYIDVPSDNAGDGSQDGPVPPTGDTVAGYPVVFTVLGSYSATAISVDTSDDLVGTRFADAGGAWFRVLSRVTGVPGNVFELDATGCASGPTTERHYPASRVVTYSANQPPMTEKHLATQYQHWQVIRGGTRYSVAWRARGHRSAEVEPETLVYDDPSEAGYPTTYAENLERDDAMSVPVGVSRARGIEITVTQAEADVYFAIDGLTLEWDAETPLVEGRR